MAEDVDDTILVPPRTRSAPQEPDLEDTILIEGHDRPVPPEPRAASPDDTSPAPSRPVASRAPAVAARSGVYALRISPTGDVIPLDEPCLIGRAPRPPRVVRGRPARLVTVPSPGREISATHIEVRQVGTTVVVTDLRSTNGTMVLVPGNAPRSLRQGETVVVSPGTLMDLGDDVVVHVLSARAAGIDPAGRQP